MTPANKKDGTVHIYDDMRSTSIKQCLTLHPDGELRYRCFLGSGEKRKFLKSDRKLDERLMNAAYESPEKIREVCSRLKSEADADRRKKSGGSAKPRVGWGELAEKSTFTRYAQRQLKRMAGAMELEIGKEKLQFLTLTVPGSTNKTMETVARFSGWIMNRIQTFLTDNYTWSSGEKYLIGCVELQKRGMLHWHFCVGLEDEKLIKTFTEKLQKFWKRLLEQLGRKVGADLFKRKNGGTWDKKWERIKDRAVNSQTVKKSAANYLAKYLSKSGGKEGKKSSKAIKYRPSRWWAFSDDAKKLVEKHTIEWKLPPISLEVKNNDIMPLVGAMLDSIDVWFVPWNNPYKKEQIGWIARASRGAWDEFLPDIVETLLDAYKENDSKLENLQKYKQSIILKNRQKHLDDEQEYWAWVALQNAQKTFVDELRGDGKKYKHYWDKIEQGWSVEQAADFVYPIRKTG